MTPDPAFFDPERPPVPLLEISSIDLFLHVNRDLNSFQRQVIRMVFDPDAGPEEYAAAVQETAKYITLLEQSGFKPVRPEGDMVLRPPHYDRFPIEPTFFIIENGIDWLRGNFLKYVCRYPYKNGIEDLRKAMRNLAMLIRYLDGDKEWSR